MHSCKHSRTSSCNLSVVQPPWFWCKKEKRGRSEWNQSGVYCKGRFCFQGYGESFLCGKQFFFLCRKCNRLARSLEGHMWFYMKTEGQTWLCTLNSQCLAKAETTMRCLTVWMGWGSDRWCLQNKTCDSVTLCSGLSVLPGTQNVRTESWSTKPTIYLLCQF